ncbi:NAD-dependent epimerase/dehydratase family protein [Polynucleobacter sp. VK25]|uniref:NAD-dependent epimerase/dehydratase family protein n=1 Tax=Polynucleobacter sp. VK25 TaxID=1758398 RepID=UPI001BFCE924|nr:NAD-dependent epimerase/dehydratase family protein [Polynucleobacter sp. VK25]QWD68647.1 NAD-dependent epimerase/dehydratase family protein [Polynucleobacter sp. VK25]
MKKIAIVGAGGYVGSHLYSYLRSRGYECTGIARNPNIEGVLKCDIFEVDKLSALINGADVVVNCVGYAHSVSSKFDKTQKFKHQSLNYESVISLAASCKKANVSKIVNISSIKAYAPDSDFYSKYKKAAEDYLRDPACQIFFSSVNLRIPMVFGKSSKGYLALMARYVKNGIFPPIPETRNRRSMIHIDDLTTAIEVAINNDNINGKVLAVSALYAPSGREIFDKFREIYGYRKLSIEVPKFLFVISAIICDILQEVIRNELPYNSLTLTKLMDDAYYPAEEFMSLTEWSPKISLFEGLKDYK